MLGISVFFHTDAERNRETDYATFAIPTDKDEYRGQTQVCELFSKRGLINIELHARKEPEAVSIDGDIAGHAAAAA